MKRILAFSLLIVLVLGLCACSSPEKSIVGTWKNQKTVFGVVTETVYTFNEDGTGTRSGVLSVDFTYTLAEDKLFITTSTFGIKNTEEYSFKLDKDKLVLTDGNETIDLEKVK